MAIKIKRLLIESDEFDDRELEDLEGVENIMQYLQAHGKDAKVVDLAGDHYVVYDDMIVDPDWPWARKKDDWLYRTEASRLRERLAAEFEDRFNKQFWQRPEPLFHGTPTENVEDIKREGLTMQHKSRGLSNRSIRAAVFTERSPEYCGYNYGPAVFEIDTIQMKKDGFMPRVEKEPNHLESDILNFIAHKIGAWDEDQDLANAFSEGTSEDTVIIYADIPPKYLKLL